MPQGDDPYALLKGLLSTNVNESDSVFQTIAKNIQFLVTNQKQIYILQQLSYANLDNALKDVNDQTLIAMNGVFFSSVFLSQFLLRKKTFKIMYLLGCAYLNFYIMQPIQIEYKLRKLAQENTLVGQEVRNLYRFYFSDSDFVLDMEKQCKLYLEAQEMKKDIYKRRV